MCGIKRQKINDNKKNAHIKKDNEHPTTTKEKEKLKN